MGFKERLRPVFRVARGLALSASLALVNATTYDIGHTSPRLPVVSEGGERLVRRPTILIYHGWGGTAEGGWIGAVKEKAQNEVKEMRGKVISTQLKQDINAKGEIIVYLEDWKNTMWEELQRTEGQVRYELLSLSGPAFLKMLEDHLGDPCLERIDRVTFWSPLDADSVNSSRRTGYSSSVFNTPANVERIRDALPGIQWKVVTSSDDDPVIYPQSIRLASKLRAKIVLFSDQGHIVHARHVDLVYQEIQEDLQ